MSVRSELSESAAAPSRVRTCAVLWQTADLQATRVILLSATADVQSHTWQCPPQAFSRAQTRHTRHTRDLHFLKAEAWEARKHIKSKGVQRSGGSHSSSFRRQDIRAQKQHVPDRSEPHGHATSPSGSLWASHRGSAGAPLVGGGHYVLSLPEGLLEDGSRREPSPRETRARRASASPPPKGDPKSGIRSCQGTAQKYHF